MIFSERKNVSASISCLRNRHSDDLLIYNQSRPCVFVLWAVILRPYEAPAADFTSPVVSILDGGTIEVLHNNRTVIADMDILIS